MRMQTTKHIHTHWEEAAHPRAGTDGCLALRREANEPADVRLAERGLYDSHTHTLSISKTKQKKTTQPD